MVEIPSKELKKINLNTTYTSFDFSYLLENLRDISEGELTEEKLDKIIETIKLNFSKQMDICKKHINNSFFGHYGRKIDRLFVNISGKDDYYGDYCDGIDFSFGGVVMELKEEMEARLALDKENARKSREAVKKKEKEDPQYAEYKRLSKIYGKKK